jgi:hypothetical protein
MAEPGTTKSGILNSLLETIMEVLPFLIPIKNSLFKIMNFFPEVLQKKDPLSTLFIYNIIELILLILSIVIINEYAHDNMMDGSKPEAVVFAVFLTIIILNVIHTTYLYLNNRDVEGVTKFFKNVFYTGPLYLIVFVFSLIMWIVSNLYGWIGKFLEGIVRFVDYVFSALARMLDDPEESRILFKYGGLYAMIFTIMIILYYAALDPAALTTKTFTYAMSIIIPMIVVLAIVIPFSQRQAPSSSFFIIGMVVTFFAAVSYFYMKANASTYKLMNYIIAILIVAMVLGGLSLFFYVIGNYLKSLPGWAGFMAYFIFYLPCLFIDFVKYIMNEFKMTSSPIFVILIFEIVLIVLYVYLPWIIQKINSSKKNELLPGSAFLDISQTISSSEINKLPKFISDRNDLTTQPVYNQNYAFSMWIFLNPQAPNFVGYASESTIFSFNSDESRGGKPKVTYFNDMTEDSNSFGKSGKDQYCVYFTNSKKNQGLYKFSMPAQKWNNLVMNFTSTQADLFINGKLEYTYIFQGNPPSYSPIDFITIGQDKGLDGAICNVTYYPGPLSLIEIANNYNLLSLRNPPTYK